MKTIMGVFLISLSVILGGCTAMSSVKVTDAGRQEVVFIDTGVDTAGGPRQKGWIIRDKQTGAIVDRAVSEGEGTLQSALHGAGTGAIVSTIAGVATVQAAKRLRPPVTNENTEINATGAESGGITVDANATGGAGGSSTSGANAQGGSSNASADNSGVQASTGAVTTGAVTAYGGNANADNKGVSVETGSNTAYGGNADNNGVDVNVKTGKVDVRNNQEQESTLVNKPNSGNTNVKNVTANVRKNSPTINVGGDNSGNVVLQNGNGNNATANANHNSNAHGYVSGGVE